MLALALLGAAYAAPLPMVPSPDVLAKTEYTRLPQEDTRDDLVRLQELFRSEDAAASAANTLHRAQLEAQSKITTLWDKLKK